MPDFTFSIEKLDELRATIVAQLRATPGSSDLLNQKLDVDAAIAALRLCAAHGIHGKAEATRLPMTQTATPSSEYRIIEDHESDDRENWTELVVNDEPVRPLPGMILIDAKLDENL